MVSGIVGDATREEIAPREFVRHSGVHIQSGDAPLPRPAEDLQAGIEWNDISFDKADGTRVERNEIAAEVKAEVEEVRSLEEERAFLREKQWKLRQIDLPRVNLGLGKIGVDGDHSAEL